MVSQQRDDLVICPRFELVTGLLVRVSLASLAAKK